MAFIKKTKAGNKIEIIDGFLCVDKKREGSKIEKLKGKTLDEAKKLTSEAMYHCGRVILTKEEGEKAKDAVKTQTAKIEKRKREERIVWESELVKHRVIMCSGHYYSNEEIVTICVLPDDMQKEYADWCRGNVVCLSLIDSKIKIRIKDSETAQAIIDDDSRVTRYTLISSESSIRIIEPAEEKAILAECSKKTEERRSLKKEEEIKQLKKILLDSVGEELMNAKEAREWEKNYNNIHNEGGYGFVPDVITLEKIDHVKKKLTELGVNVEKVIKEQQDALLKPQKSTILKAVSCHGGECVIRFEEDGYTVLSDERECKDGYLHICSESAVAITENVRDEIIKYFYKHGEGLPGVGGTPQTKYFKGLTIEQKEAIGNNGKKAFYS